MFNDWRGNRPDNHKISELLTVQMQTINEDIHNSYKYSYKDVTNFNAPIDCLKGIDGTDLRALVYR